MRRLILVLLVALALPAAAAAKGPDRATLSGPGLARAITIRGDGETSETGLGQLSMLAGFFPAAYRESPDPMLDRAPTRDLGPRYRIHYRVPGGDQTTYRIDQDVYPYARGGAVTYTKPGQRVFGMHARGGWFRGGTQLTIALKRLGLPARTTSLSRATGSGSNAGLVAGIAVPGALALTAAVLLYRRRRSA